MPLKIVRNDITQMNVDAIVNAARPSLLGGGGVDGAIHRAAGPGLVKECQKLGGCNTGEAKITKGYKLPSKYVIHTVGPVYSDGAHGEKELLASCYKSSLALAKKYKCESVAFPLISSGAYGYPKDQALKVAVDVIGNFLLENDMTVYITVFDKQSFVISEKLFFDVSEYIDDVYVEEHTDLFREQRRRQRLCQEAQKIDCTDASVAAPQKSLWKEIKYASSLEKSLNELDESFSQMLLRKIDEKGISDSACYKKANVDRKLFSKIRSDIHYKPSKNTVIAFVIALELPLEEAVEMLRKAGFALSHSNKFDVIIEYFIKNENYNIFEINEVLFAFDQTLLGV